MTNQQLAEHALTPSHLVGERLKSIRKLRGWSAKQLAERCAQRGASNLTPYVIANIETRRRTVSIDDLLALAYACDVALVYFLTLPESESSVSLTDNTTADDNQVLQRWVRGDAPLPGMDEQFFAQHGKARAAMSDVEYGRALLLSGSKRLISQYDARAEEFLKRTRTQVRDVIGDLRQAVTSDVPPSDLLEFLSELESGLVASAESRFDH